MSKPLEHDIVRPWLCCKECRQRYKEDLTVNRLRDGTKAARAHDNKVDAILEVMYG